MAGAAAGALSSLNTLTARDSCSAWLRRLSAAGGTSVPRSPSAMRCRACTVCVIGCVIERAVTTAAAMPSSSAMAARPASRARARSYSFFECRVMASPSCSLYFDMAFTASVATRNLSRDSPKYRSWAFTAASWSLALKRDSARRRAQIAT